MIDASKRHVPGFQHAALLIDGSAYAYYQRMKSSMPSALTGKPVPVEMMVEPPTELKGVELKIG